MEMLFNVMHSLRKVHNQYQCLAH